MAENNVGKRPANFKDISGRKFGRLTVVGFSHIQNGRAMWLCLCDCGTKTIVSGRNMRNGVTKSCGCLQQDIATKIHTTHGMYGTSEHRSWKGVIERCTNPNHKRFKDYGGRGITVCQRWLDSFENFYADMGPKPSDGKRYTIERINNDLGYCKENCKWATYKEQANNRRKARKRVKHQ